MGMDLWRKPCRVILRLCLIAGASLPALAQNVVTAQGDQVFEKLGRMVAAIDGDPARRRSYEQWFDQQGEALRARARGLAEQGGARNLLLAAALNDLPESLGWFDAAATEASAQSRQWREAALSVRPRDRLASWVEAAHCSFPGSGCESTATVMFLLQNEPDNAVAYLWVLDAAGRRNDVAAMRQALHQAGQATRYDTHLQEWMMLVNNEIRAVGSPPMDPALIAAIEGATGSDQATIIDGIETTFLSHLVLATPMSPPLKWLMTLCSARDLDEQGRGDCIGVMGLIARDGTSVLEQFAGTIGMVRLSTADADSRAWRERLRRISWINENASELLPISMIDNAMRYGAFLQWSIDQGEFSAYNELLVRNGIATTPPDGWLPDNPRRRALITTGSDEGF